MHYLYYTLRGIRRLQGNSLRRPNAQSYYHSTFVYNLWFSWLLPDFPNKTRLCGAVLFCLHSLVCLGYLNLLAVPKYSIIPFIFHAKTFILTKLILSCTLDLKLAKLTLFDLVLLSD